MRALVLAYHSHNISGTGYAENDHVALERDLASIQARGLRIVALREVARLVREGAIDGEGERLVGLSFDDGPVFDFADFVHPSAGPQKSMFNILREFRARHGAGAQPGLNATSFVIASPDARAAMERSPDCGYEYLTGWLTDRWWAEAAGSGLLDIGNHSWDHVHHAVDRVALASEERDDFTKVDTYPVADAQVRRAAGFINARCGGTCTLFAYPFGHANDYLIDQYFPQRASEHGMIAAFGTSGRWIGPRTSPWNIPRAVCGEHWHSPGELEALLES